MEEELSLFSLGSDESALALASADSGLSRLAEASLPSLEEDYHVDAEKSGLWWQEMACLYRQSHAAAVRRKFAEILQAAIGSAGRDKLVAALKGLVGRRARAPADAFSALLLILSAKPNKRVIVQAIADELLG